MFSMLAENNIGKNDCVRGSEKTMKTLLEICKIYKGNCHDCPAKGICEIEEAEKQK